MAVRCKLRNAYATRDHSDAKRALDSLLHQLMHLNPSAARSLEEGKDETLTVHQLRVPTKLRASLASTNVIESAFSVVETVCKNVKRWQGGDQYSAGSPAGYFGQSPDGIACVVIARFPS